MIMIIIINNNNNNKMFSSGLYPCCVYVTGQNYNYYSGLNFLTGLGFKIVNFFHLLALICE